MNNVEKLKELIHMAEQTGDYKQRFYISIVLDKILYNSHYATLFNVAFLKALFGEQYTAYMHKMVDTIISGGDPIDYLYKSVKSFQKEAQL